MVNTWSVIGFLDEAYDNAQISIGTHESDWSKLRGLSKQSPIYNNNYLQTSGQLVMAKYGI